MTGTIVTDAVYTPQKPLGNTLTPQGTPMHVAQAFIALQRQCFSELPEEHPFRFVPDDFERTGVLFDTSYNKDSEAVGKKPLIVVTRGAQSTSPIMYRDIGSMDPRTGHSFNSGIVASSVMARIIGRSRGEVDLLGQHVFGFCMMSRVALPKLLGVHMVDSIALTDPARFEQDDAMYATLLTVSYSMQFIWTRLNSETRSLTGVAIHFQEK